MKKRGFDAFIFDLDQTLIDSRSLQILRDGRKWGEVYKHIPNIKVYDEINNIMKLLKETGKKIGMSLPHQELIVVELLHIISGSSIA